MAFVRTTAAAWEPRTPCWNLFLSPFPSICCLSCWKSLISSRWWCRWFFRWPLRSLALEHAFHSSTDRLERLIGIKLNCGRVLCLMIYRIFCYPCLCRIFLSTSIWCDSRLPKHRYRHNRAARKISKCMTCIDLIGDARLLLVLADRCCPVAEALAAFRFSCHLTVVIAAAAALWWQLPRCQCPCHRFPHQLSLQVPNFRSCLRYPPLHCRDPRLVSEFSAGSWCQLVVELEEWDH